jgi:integrase
VATSSQLVLDSPASIATPRRRGPSLARRKYQSGHVFQKGKKLSDTWDPIAPAYVSYWKDMPGGSRRRVPIPLGPCRTRTIATRNAAAQLEKLAVNSTQTFIESTCSTTFAQQGEIYLQRLATRKRNPLEQSTIDIRRYILDKWIYPQIGDTLLSGVSNLAMKELVSHLVSKELSPASIASYTFTVKDVVASAIDENGEQLYPRKWNTEFIDAPIIEDQNQPVVDQAGLEALLKMAEGRLQVLYALLAGCGPLRVGEALGLEIKHISPDFRTLRIEQKAKCGKLQPYLKTANGEREVDLCSDLSDMLREHVGGRTTGLVFCNREGAPLLQSGILMYKLHPLLRKLNLPKGGFNIFRRFRMKHIDLSPCPKSLQHFWSGHAQTHISERYVHLLGDRALRVEWAEKLGMGFALPNAQIHAVKKLA